mgnify:CR=1 FL=1
MSETDKELGILIGTVDGIKEDTKYTRDKLDTMEARLRAVEKRSSVYGIISGALSGFAVTIFGGNIGGS